MKKGPVERFASRESIKGLKSQLEHTTDGGQRKTLSALLAEEGAKAKQLANEADPNGREIKQSR